MCASEMDRIQPQRIRRLVLQLVRRHQREMPEQVCEQLLIRGGHYCGHSYQLGPIRAIWFRDEDQLKLYDEHGSLIEVIRPSELKVTDGPGNRAA